MPAVRRTWTVWSLLSHFTPYPNAEETFEFTSSVVGGAIPKEYIPAVEQGIQGAMLTGVLAGYPVRGV